MDAKLCGNIGRFFNHSCSPNIYVQNVFVDTYDLRFPWVCFFSIDAIKAGTELCWDYNYTIGSVKGYLFKFFNYDNFKLNSLAFLIVKVKNYIAIAIQLIVVDVFFKKENIYKASF